VAAKIANLEQGRPSEIKPANLPVSQGEAADLLNVSERSVRSARHVLDEGASELVNAVEQGELAVSTAAEIATGSFPVDILSTGRASSFDGRGDCDCRCLFPCPSAPLATHLRGPLLVRQVCAARRMTLALLSLSRCFPLSSFSSARTSRPGVHSFDPRSGEYQTTSVPAIVVYRATVAVSGRRVPWNWISHIDHT